MSDHQASQEPITLPLGDTAEPRACGSCTFYERQRDRYGHVGYCTIRLPKWVSSKDWDGESQPPREVSDADGCDLHRHTGKAYVVSRIVRP